MTNTIIIKKFEIFHEYQNVTQRREVSKCGWEKDAPGLAQLRVATNLQFVKKKKKKHYLRSAIKGNTIN